MHIKESKEIQTAKDHWVLSRLFVIVEVIKNSQNSVVKVRGHTDDLKRITSKLLF